MDYQNLYTNFKNNSDVDEEQCAPFFEKATDEEIKTLTALYDTCVSGSPVWKKEDLTELKEIKIPSQLIQFYQELNPVNAPMNNAGITLADLAGIKEEYLALAPGCYMIKWGFLVIATTIGGDPVLIDLNDAALPVYIADHTLLMGDGSCEGNKVYFPDPTDELNEEYGKELVPVTYKNIKKCMLLIEDRFDVFMDKLSCDEYDDLEEMLDEMN